MKRFGMLAVGIGVLLAATFAAPAAAVAQAGDSQHCVLVADPLRPGEKESRTSTICAGSQAAAERAVPAANTLLARVYAHVNYGEPSTPIYGRGGPCDFDGYRINARAANNAVGGISSYAVYNRCDASAIDDGAGNTASFCGSTSWVGPGINDRVYYMSLWDGC